jgi:hypothetical protein
MARADLEEFYGLVEVGDTVELIGERNQQTAKLFGDGQKPALPPVETAAAATIAIPAQLLALENAAPALPAMAVLMASR